MNGRLDNNGTGPTSTRFDSLAPGPDYNQEYAKKWVLLRSLSGKDFPCPANILGQLLWRAEFLRDDSSSRTSIYKIDEINVDAFEGLLASTDTRQPGHVLPLPYSQAHQSSGKDFAMPEDY